MDHGWAPASRACRFQASSSSEARSMRTHLFRGAVALAALLFLSSSASAQSVVRGKVNDAQGKPVEGATVLFEAEGVNRKTQTKTDKNGDFLQVGLSSGAYKVTASKEGVGTQTLSANVRQGPNNPMSFSLSAASGMTAADKEAAVATQAAAGAALEAMKAGNHADAIAEVQRGDRQGAQLRRVLLQHRRRADAALEARRGRSRIQEGNRAQARLGRRLHRPRQSVQRAEEVRPRGRGQRQGVAALGRRRRRRRRRGRATTRA